MKSKSIKSKYPEELKTALIQSSADDLPWPESKKIKPLMPP